MLLGLGHRLGASTLESALGRISQRLAPTCLWVLLCPPEQLLLREARGKHRRADNPEGYLGDPGALNLFLAGLRAYCWQVWGP